MEVVDRFIANLLRDLKNNKLKLPTLPQIALKISDTIDNPDATAKDMAKVLGTDAALSARLIKVANSAMYRGHSKVEDLRTAITRLGMKIVRNIVNGLLIRQLFLTNSENLKARMHRLWLRTTRVAAISFLLASKYTRLKPEEAMLAGLIHSIGELPIVAYMEGYPEISEDEVTLEQILNKIGPALGKAILKAWDFSPELVTVAAEYNNINRENGGDIDYADIVIVALLHSYVGTDSPRADINWGDIPAFKKLGLTPDESIATLKEAHDDLTEIQNLFN